MRDELSTPIVDSHVHLWDPGRFRMPWLDTEPALRKSFGMREFVEASSGLDVEAIVYVQVDVTPAYGLLEARWAASEAARDPRIGGIVAWAPLEDGAVARTLLDELVALGPHVKGVRRLIQSESAPDFVLQPSFLEGVRLLPEYGFSFDICIKHHQLASSIRMVRACPETSFILDHVGKPDIRAGLLDPWRERLAELASLPNVVCKLSGLVTEADTGHWTDADLEPYVSHTLAIFGEDRVLFGGDWPVVTLASDYRRWVDTLSRLTRDLSPEAKAKLWRFNARRVYRF
jgi:L-fuconolactonase